jgi:protein-L-isoaspartate(D-aspartate) O-methyltransferase
MSRINDRLRLVELMRERGIRDAAVLAAMGTVPRELFVPAELAAEAYEDQALPIECQQTISQPFIVAAMTEALRLGKTSRVLEIGTGSGYQAAILAHLAAEVFSIEVYEPLLRTARLRLLQLGLGNVTLKCGDGSLGWPCEAPFDRIIVTAAAPAVPPALLEQLAPDGRMVLPLGRTDAVQELAIIDKVEGEIVRHDLFPVRFVPLTHGPRPADGG